MQYTFHIFGVIQQQTLMKMSIILFTYNYTCCDIVYYLNSQQYGASLFVIPTLF